MYNHQEIESKWKEFWDKNKINKTSEDLSRPKYYILDMFPYPSGTGIHVGHLKGYIATDILARYKKMKGFNVLHPMGWDAFGLPAENYAIKNKVHPRIATEANINNYKRQLSLVGFSYDWEKEISTTDPSFYKWTQWIFIKLLEKGLAYESFEAINWCPSCKTGLANEDLEDGKCERCSSEIEKKPLRQWVLKIKDYADRLISDLDKLDEWEDSIKEMQRNWIGRSEGAVISFKFKDANDLKMEVFTTRIDTIFACTYLVLAPEHHLVQELKDKINNWDEVVAYIEKIKNKSDLERTDLNKDKSGVKLEGIKGINPFNGQELDVFIADYVLYSYGTGAVMAVPAHDERDFEFSQKHGLQMKTAIIPESSALNNETCFTEDGILINSGEFSDLKSAEAREKMIDYGKNNNFAYKKVNYRLADWVFSRQRYWGEPIPVVHCEKCGVVALSVDDLPLELPEVESYEPSGTGESPLANIHDWVNVKCPKCDGPARRETNTMPQWAGSSWYYLRYIDPLNNDSIIDKDKEAYWSPVDFYVGGAEHAARHLIYARFWHKFLYDIGVVKYDEPFKKLKSVGLIYGEDGQKMSKRWGNVINPDDIVKSHGADSLRVYEMFMSPFGDACAWNSNGLVGVRKFIDKIYRIVEDNNFSQESSKESVNLLHKSIKKISEDIESFKFNTAVSQMMIFINHVFSKRDISQKDFSIFLTILAPFAPHVSEELFHVLNPDIKDSVFVLNWPEYNDEYIKDDIVKIAIQINGKLRDTIDVALDTEESEVLEIAKQRDLVGRWLDGKEVVKVIYIKNKLLNIVVK